MSPDPYWSDAQIALHLGDCVEVLAGMDAASVDAVVTDPPYGLEFMGKEWDSFGRQRPYAERGGYGDKGVLPGYGRGGHSEDVDRFKRRANHEFQAWCEKWAAECLRVLKPGGHLLAFGGTRTYHRLASGIEDAGFEVRDSLHWIYGSGFPKSLDVSKAIDKRAEENVETKRRIAAVAEVIRSHREAKEMTPQQVSLAVVGTPSGACWNWEHQQLPSVEMWPAIKAALGIPDDYDGLLEGDRSRFLAAERAVVGTSAEGAGNGSVVGLGSRPTMASEYDLTVSATKDATHWEGWGTALKPSHEPIVVARKPLAGTVAQNVLAHGTGALNVDGCRVAHQNGENPSAARRAGAAPGREIGSWANDRRSPETFAAERPGEAAGRWPPNVLLGPEAAVELDRQSGVLTSGANPTRRGSDKFRDAYGDFAGQTECTPRRGADSGGASRFFPVFRYEAKAASHERPRGEDGTAHPTVKPVPLMRWLARLVTPPAGLVCDPFAGSGTTGEACIVEGFRCVLIEKDPASVELIQARLRKPIQPDMFGGIAS